MTVPLKRQSLCWHLRDSFGRSTKSFISKYSYGDRVRVLFKGRYRFGTITAAQLDRDGNFTEWLVEVRNKPEHAVATVRKGDPYRPT